MRPIRPRSLAALLVAAPLALAAALPLAGDDAADPIAARQTEMKGVLDAMKGLSAIARKQAPFDAAVVAKNAGAIASHLESARPLFPAGSDAGAIETWAKAEIWANPADFDAKMVAAHDAAAELAKVTDESAYVPALVKLGDACKACHEPYRRPKE
jgi:cytochrome c556